jgi:hypothetical protein
MAEAGDSPEARETSPSPIDLHYKSIISRVTEPINLDIIAVYNGVNLT